MANELLTFSVLVAAMLGYRREEMGNESLTLFVLVTAMLAYRTVDLLSTRQKLDQIAKRAPCARNGQTSFGQRREVRRSNGVHARTALAHLRWVMLLRKEFYAAMMGLYLLIFAGIGYSVLTIEAVQSGRALSLVVAGATALVSLIYSAVNLEVERVKVYVERVKVYV